MFSYMYNWTVAKVIRQAASKTYVTHEDEVLHIPSRDAGRTIKAHLYKNPRASSQPFPVLLNWHGSGFVIPQHGSDDEFALKVINSTSYAVLDVSYRLAPEDPFPAATNDAEDAVKYVLAHPEMYDVTRLSVSGFSAGGTLALGLCSHVFPPDTFKHILAFYPPTDLTVEPADKVTPDPEETSIPNWLASTFNECYAPSGRADRAHPLISPAKIEASHFPKNALIITCAHDNLAPETEELAERMEKAGINVKRRRMAHCKHGWDKDYAPGSIQEQAKDEAYAMAVEMLQK